jgi:hypothetical protein
LGELVCKIIAAGGGDVTLTYATGREDALRVQEELVGGGTTCRVISYDSLVSARQQLATLSEAPNQVYYMATPPIFGRRMEPFARERLQRFLSFYVSGFYDLYTETRARFGKNVAFFYPSSAFLESRPANMTEYAMAKAAGEVLCADLKVFDSPSKIILRRLPRLPTDQTSTLFEDKVADSVAELLPAVRDVHQSAISNS